MAAAGSIGLCCNPIRQHQHHFFYSDPSHHPHNSITMAMAAQTWMTSSLEEEGEAGRVEGLWLQFFSDPSQWRDRRSDKRNPRFPDFTHKTAKKALWIEYRVNPSWVQARLAAMVQGKEQGQSVSTTSEISGHAAKIKMEQLWQEFFLDPSQWWDNRFIKKSPKYPDFKHKITDEGLWIEGWLTPAWVKPKMATMALGQIQSGGGMRSWLPHSFCIGDDVSKLCQEGRLTEALHMVELMLQHNIKPPFNTYGSLLKGCVRRKALVEGKRVHALVVQSGLDSDIFLGKALVDMYAKCGSVLDARKVFNTMPEQNVFLWTAIISAYADHGQGEEALNLFQEMQQAGIAPDKVAFLVVLKACARIAALEQGKQLHSDIIRSGLESDVNIGNTLVDMYAKCGSLEHARQVFNKMSERTVVSWSAIIAGYAQNGLAKEALALYEQMEEEGVQPNNVTYVILLKVCARMVALEKGKQLHLDIMRNGFDSDVIVGNTLVDMYAKCGCIEHARQVFDKMADRDVVSWNSMIAGYVKCGCIEHARQIFNKMSERNVVSWSAMIAGYAQNGLSKEALALYEQMKQEDVQPNNVTYAILLKACARIAALEEGKQLHSHIKRSGFELDVIVGSALVDMYAKCGRIEHARQVFNKMSERDVVSWNAMIVGYAQQGLGNEALTLLEQMQREGTKPDEATYVSVLSACSHSGLVNEGRHLFDSMCKGHGFTPTMKHYACVVDLLGRSGCLADAEDLITKMPI